MNDGNFIKVFDLLDSGFKNWQFPAFGLIFVVIGLGLFFAPKILAKAGIPYLELNSKRSKYFRYFFLGFAILWTTFTFLATYSRYQRHRRLLSNGNCQTVEGPVEQFIPMPASGHASESFTVSGVRFSYSDFAVSDAFNNTTSHGGPISEGAFVRICYDPSGNQILRLEIKDFKGPVKDYAKSESVFPGPGTLRGDNGNPIHYPWYANLFYILFLLDVFARLALFVPYIKTYFRLKSVEISDCSIPQNLAGGGKTKLRNSLVLWDESSKAIWLRPRGLNALRVQFMVAQLKVDDRGQNIIGYDLRFSSGIPFIMILFLWTGYLFFSMTMPKNGNGPSPALFMGIATVVFLISGVINLVILRGRMETVVEDAISEIRSMQR